MFLDARGKACPMPVIMAKRELDGGCRDLTVAADNPTAVQNLTRLASGRGMQVAVEERDGVFHVRMTGTPGESSDGAEVREACPPTEGGCAVFLTKTRLGDGDETLGRNLLRMALYTLAQSDVPPAAVLLMNSGVKLAAGEDGEIAESLRTLAAGGTEVLVCGTCLNHYGLTEALRVGTVSNMYDILGRMTRASKVITL